MSQDGQSLADTYSARPGSSEHQTGLALDINTASVQAHFENTPTYALSLIHISPEKWLSFPGAPVHQLLKKAISCPSF